MSVAGKHRGVIIEKAVRGSGYSIKALAEKLSFSRNTLYNKFKEHDLSYDTIIKIGEIIRYDFSVDFPEIKKAVSLDKNINTVELLKLEHKYTGFLERYNTLFAFLIRIANGYSVEEIRKDVNVFLSANTMYKNTQQKVTKEQREAVGLLSIGTFLEYLDLSLYIHMAVLLNGLFFPPTDPLSEKLLSAMVFCTTFIFRPIGALLFGWIGDKIGRKSTVVITTMIMAICCVIMAVLPTYETIGYKGSLIIMMCRVLQGLTTLAEITGAEIYVAETIKPPAQYFHVGLIDSFGTLGMTCAIGFAALVTSYGFNWRYAFWAGSLIAIIGSIARIKLRETPEFVYANNKAKDLSEKMGLNPNSMSQDIDPTEPKVARKTTFAYFAVQCLWPVCFYFAYVHCANVLKQSFGFSSEQILSHNFKVAAIELVYDFAMCFVCYYINPLKVSKILAYGFLCAVIICPYLMGHASCSLHILFVQLIIVAANPSLPSTMPILFKYFPTLKRFRYTSFLYALSRSFMFVITSFGIIYVTEWFGNFGLLLIMVPTVLCFIIGLRYFEKLEIEAGNYPSQKQK